jgi:vacuolar protein sorting-associated protein 51
VAFDAKAYYEQLITTSSLTGLLKRENELSAGWFVLFRQTKTFVPPSLSVCLSLTSSLVPEVRQLDGERQSLVYNHHHELIAASDTIRAVCPIPRGKGGRISCLYVIQMKSRAENLDADLEKLKVAFSEISRLASDVAIAEHLTKKDSGEPIGPISQSGQDAQ